MIQLLLFLLVSLWGVAFASSNLDTGQCSECRNGGFCYQTSDYLGPSATINCPSSWILSGSKCYKIIWHLTTQFNAQKSCTEADQISKLIDLSEDLPTFLKDIEHLLTMLTPNFWVSISKDGQTRIIHQKYQDPMDGSHLATQERIQTEWAIPICTRPIITSFNRTHTQCKCPKAWIGEKCEVQSSNFNHLIGDRLFCGQIPCANSSNIFVEFAAYGLYSTSRKCNEIVEHPLLPSLHTDCYSANTLAIMKYWCQGKSECDIQHILKHKIILNPCQNTPSEPRSMIARIFCKSNLNYCPDSDSGTISTFYNGTCLAFINGNWTWWEAHQLCYQKGGSLAFLPSLFLPLKYFNVPKPIFTYKIWIGGQSNSSIVDSINHPCSYLEVNPKTQTATVHVEESRICDLGESKHLSVCNFTFEDGKCETKIVNFGTSQLCLQMVRVQKSWKEAKAFCKKFSGNLLSHIHSYEQQIALIKFLNEEITVKQIEFWTGGIADEFRPLASPLLQCSMASVKNSEVISKTIYPCDLRITKDIALCAFPPSEPPYHEDDISTNNFYETTTSTHFVSASTAKSADISTSRTKSTISTTQPIMNSTISTTQPIMNSTITIVATSSTELNKELKSCHQKIFKSHRGEIMWPQTEANEWQQIPCPGGRSGQMVKWFCNGNTGDFSPSSGADWSDCRGLKNVERLINQREGSPSERATDLLEVISQQDTLYGSDLDDVIEVMNHLRDDQRELLSAMEPEERQEAAHSITNKITDIVDILLSEENNDAWLDHSPEERAQASSKLMLSVDSTSFILAETMDNESKFIRKVHIDVQVSSFSRSAYKDKPISAELDLETGTFVTIPSQHAEYPNNSISSVFTKYKNVTTFFPNKLTDSKSEFVLNSEVLGGSVVNENSTFHFDSDFVVVGVRHIHPNSRKTVCVFWNLTGFWDSSGCFIHHTNVTHTVCHCNHLTNFAVLMDMHSTLKADDIHTVTLTWITIVGCTVSIICLTITVIVMIALSTLWNLRSTIHCNLCITLIFAQLLLLVGLERTETKVVCSIIAGLLHFAWTSAFAWMALEGVHLYILLIKVFDTGRQKTWLYYLIGYGMPAMIVSISVACKPSGYGTYRHCWLSSDDGFLFAFFIPIAAVILFNFFIFVLAMRVASSIKAESHKTMVQKARKWMRRSASLVPLLGISWIFGFLFVNENSVVFAYCFAIFNSTQGVFIFIFYCVLNEKFQEKIERFFEKRREQQEASRFRKVRANSYTVTTTVLTETSADNSVVTEDSSFLNQSLAKRFQSTPRVVTSKLRRILTRSPNQTQPTSDTSKPQVLSLNATLHTESCV